MKKRPKQQELTREELRDQFESSAIELGLHTDVFSMGPINSRIVVIGEGPGETEIRKGLPFVGGAGRLLWDSLDRFGINSTNVYTTNVVKRQISLSRKGNERHSVHRDELEKWVGLAKWELAQLPNAEVIFAMGNYALEACADHHGILNWRGSVLDSDLPNGRKGKIVCTINPAYAQRVLMMEPFFRQDCSKLDIVNRGVFKPHTVDALINPTYREAMAFIRDLSRAKKPVSFDIEAINKETACIGLGNDPHKAMCINFRDVVRNRFTSSEEYDIWMAIQKLCESHKIVAQNGNFDAYWTRLHDWLRVSVWFDTLLAHHTLFPQLPHNLGFLTAQYTNHPFYKDEGKGWKEGGDLNSFWEYNCKDVAITYAVYEKESRELEREGLTKFYFDHVMRAQPHLSEATVHGVAVDEKITEIINEQVYADVAAAEKEFHRLVQELTGDEDYYPNPRSWPQMQVLYFDVLKLQGRGRSTDKDNRAHMIKHPDTPPLARELLVAVNRFAKEDKFRGTYAESKVSDDGRFRCEYKQYGVVKAPGRLSSAALLGTGEGGNMQNQPMRARAKFVADDGCVFCYFDLKQAEAQVVAYRADIPIWKDQFERSRTEKGYDCHRALASLMFNMPYDEVPKDDWDEDNMPTPRYKGKRCRHALNYRMEKFRLSEVLDLPYHESARLWGIYHKVTPELGTRHPKHGNSWWAQEEKQFRATRMVFNAYGRRLRVIQRLPAKAEDDEGGVLDSIIAFYPQSTIGDKITRAWYMAEEDDDWPVQEQARIAIDVHDNLVAIATPKVAKTVLRIMKKHAQEPLMIQNAWNDKAEKLIIDADLKMSYPTVWDKNAPVKNSEGKITGRGAFVESKDGLHRWSHMKEVTL